MCEAVPILISPSPSELEPIVSWRHDGLEQRQPARFAIWSFVLGEKLSRLFFAIGSGYTDSPHANWSVTVFILDRKQQSLVLIVFVAGIVPPKIRLQE